MKKLCKYLALTAGIVISFFAQQPPKTMARPMLMRAQSSSTIALTGKGDEQTLDITNVAFESMPLPGRSSGERILLRKTTNSKYVLGEKGQEATTMFEAWPLGTDLKQKPLYTLKATGVGGETVDGSLIVVERGLEEVDWWSIYRLDNGQHLFDTYVPLLSFSISTETVETRYIGLNVPPDDAAERRLKRVDLVAVISYSSEERVKREIFLTCDNAKQAAELRSYWDTTRKVSVSDELPPRSLTIGFRGNDAKSGAPLHVTIPLVRDDLDIVHAQLPPHLHLVAGLR